jgi:apoptotic chromatin condensation inducer in the nucleus
MSSQYPILDNRPIDQWKVTELKEELKRRKLTTKGLKDDLIRRLDEAIRIERENAAREIERENILREIERENALREIERENALREIERENAAKEIERENAAKYIERENPAKDVVERESDAKDVERENAAKGVDNGFEFGAHSLVGSKDVLTVPVVAETAEDLADHSGKKNKSRNADNVMVQVDINESAAALDRGKFEEGDTLGHIDSSRVEEELVVHTTTVETTIEVTETVVSEVALSGQASENIETHEENGNSKSQLENEDPKPHLEIEESMPQFENEDTKPEPENEGLKPPSEGVMLDLSTPDNQVSEVDPILGSQVKSDSISTDSVSINEKIELKDNVIADHVKLELDVVKPEMLEPSSSNVVPVGGESHPMDVEEPSENKASDGGKDSNNATDADISKKIDSADVGYSEKLNLDRSSGDDSMEEDVLESKQIDSKYNSEEVENKSEKIEVLVVKEESRVSVLGDSLSAEKKDFHVESKNHPAAPAEKRKLNGKPWIQRVILNFYYHYFFNRYIAFLILPILCMVLNYYVVLLWKLLFYLFLFLLLIFL